MGRAMLLIALGLSSVMGRMLYSINERTLDLSESSFRHYTRTVARNIANSGANIAVSHLYRDFSWRTGLDTTIFNGGTFRATVTDVAIDTPLAVSRALVTAIGSYNGVTDTVQALVAKPAFSYFVIFFDDWSGTLATGDTLWGPLHANDYISFSGTPVFFEKVTSTHSTVPGTPKFYGGAEFDAPAISLPFNLSALIDSANNGGDVYAADENVWIRFNADGTYDYGDDNTFSAGTKQLADYNGIIMLDQDDKSIHVQGTVHGQVTIYSRYRIYIEDDLVYLDNPLVNPASQDMLGLIAEDDVVVAQNTANNNNCVIHAAIMALDDEFKVQNHLLGLSRGTLTVVGSVVQRQRGGIGSLLSGYVPDWQYDPRFLQAGPPNFPLISRVVVLAWND